MLPDLRIRSSRAIVVTAWLACVTALVAPGCGTSSKLVEEWRDPEYTAGPLRNIYVIALKPDPVKRRIWEEAFVEALAKRGAKATASYHDFPDALPDTLSVVTKVRTGGYDGLLVTYKTGSGQTTSTMPTTTRRDYVGYSRDWTGRYVECYREVETQGYTETESVVGYETTLWQAARGGKMIWTGSSVTTNPSSSGSLGAELSKLVIPRIVKAGML